MKWIFFTIGGIFALVCTAAVLMPQHTPTVAPTSPSQVSTHTPISTPAPATHSVPKESHSPISSPGDQCIGCGPGDNICKAPGDCGYGDNPGGCPSCYDQSKVTEEDLAHFNCLTMGNKTCGGNWTYLDTDWIIAMELDDTTSPENWDQCLVLIGDTTYIDCPSGHIYTS